MKSLDIYSKYTIKRVNDLRDILSCEYNLYRNYMYKTAKDYALAGVKCENVRQIMRWQHYARLSDYHDYQYHMTGLSGICCVTCGISVGAMFWETDSDWR